MILYNVTCHVDDEISEDWLKWMVEEHIPEVMQTGKFMRYRMFSIDKHHPSDPGKNYSIQYEADSRDKYHAYVQENAEELKAKTQRRFGDKVAAFRTLLELVSE